MADMGNGNVGLGQMPTGAPGGAPIGPEEEVMQLLQLRGEIDQRIAQLTGGADPNVPGVPNFVGGGVPGGGVPGGIPAGVPAGLPVGGEMAGLPTGGGGILG